MNRSAIIYISWVITLINFLLIGIYHPRTTNLGFDYIGAIVGILSLLIALLAIMFGYNILGIKRQISKEVDNKSNNLRAEITNIIIENEIDHNITLAQFHQKKEEWDNVIFMCTRTAICYAKCNSTTKIEIMYQLIDNARIESDGKLDSLTIQSLIEALKGIKDIEAFKQIQTFEYLIEQNASIIKEEPGLENFPKVEKEYNNEIIIECIKRYTDKKEYCFNKSNKGWGCKHLKTPIDKNAISTYQKAKLFSKVYREAKQKGIVDCPHFRSLNLDDALEAIN